VRAPAREIVALLFGGAVANVGLRVAAVALPWFVLTSTGSAVQTGLVVACELGPYVVAKALSGPLVDRWGQRRVSMLADLGSAVMIGAIPVLFALGALAWPVLLIMVALGGALRGPGDNAKDTSVPLVAARAGVPLERVTGLYGAVERGSGLAGPALAAILIVVIGAAGTLALTAACFAACALIWRLIMPADVGRIAHETMIEGSYLTQMREGLRFLIADRLLLTLVLMILVTNLLDIAKSAVFLPVWVVEHGYGVSVVGLVLTCFALTAMISSLLASAIGERLPRRRTYFVAFLFAGPPPFLALALDLPVPAVAVVYGVAGFASGFLNPLLGAIFFERIPQPLLGRVGGLADGICWAGVPFGGLVAAGLIALCGLTPALAVAGALYGAATLLPALTSRASFERPSERRDGVEVELTSRTPSRASAGRS
jgi:MFS family permease